MNLTRTIIVILFLFFNISFFAQNKNSYYFKDFTNGQVILKNKQFARGKFNYDFANHQMHFLNGGVDMIVENLQDIDTIIIDKTRFIPFEGRFVELMKGKKTFVLVEKSINTRERGKVGAMGVATHGTVQVIDVNTRFQRVNGENNMDVNIYKDELKYTYFLLIKGCWKSFHNQATFLKLFPKKRQDTVKETIKSMGIDFDSPEEVTKLCNEIN